MVEDLSSDPPASRSRRRSGRDPKALARTLAAISSLAIVVGLSCSSIAPRVGGPGSPQATAFTPTQGTVAALGADTGTPSSKAETPKPLPSDPLAPLPPPSASSKAGIGPHSLFAEQEPARPVDSQPLPETALTVRTVPLPVPRPPELRGPNASEASRRADRQASQRTRTTALPATKEDDRSFFETLFGIERSQAPALAYAALENPAIDAMPRRRLSPVPVPDAGGAAAVYDITARIVTLPNGETLEAHSGLGESMDDPRYVNVRMRGATPPGTYDLTEREQPFHGVRALRLNPVGGSAAVHNRTGLLAHTYLLGPSGASNGCVSFKDYEKFLQAYLRGEFQRLVVVLGQGQDVLPVIASKATPIPVRPARRSGDMKVATLP